MTNISGWVLLLRGAILTYGFALLAQLISAATGLVLVNLLAKDEFAVFAVFTALVQAFVAQSDLGTSGAVGYFYREHSSWDSFKTMALPAIVRMRLLFFVVGGIVLLILFVNSPATQVVTAIRISELLFLTLATACFGMVNALQLLVLLVRGDASTSVRIEAATNLVRLALVLGMVVFHFVSAEAALIATLASTIFSFLIGHLYIPEIPLGLPRKYNNNELRRLFRYVLPLIPGFLYSALQPSILIWLSAIFGNTERVAEIGALSRIGQIIGLLALMLNLFALPHLARLRDERAFRRSYVFIWLILCCVASAVFVGVTLLRRDILLLLGPKYSNLDNEVILVAGTSILFFLGYYPSLVNRVRGWTKLEPLNTIGQLTAQAVLIACLPLNSTEGILIVGLGFAGVSVPILFAINIIGFVKPSWATIRPPRIAINVRASSGSHGSGV
jgi:O-antigen/teichoic acid export membrane protein